MRKYLCIAIISITIISMASIWPFCLIRRETVFSCGATSSVYLDEINENCHIRQEFKARASYLYGLSIVVSTDSLNNMEGHVICELENNNNEILQTWNIPLSEISSDSYYDLSVNQWLKKGETYSINLHALGNSPIVKYTITSSEYLSENTETFYNGEAIEGQMSTRYFWGLPLNYKNVLCIWAFILTVAGILWEITNRNSKQQQ